MRNLPAGSSGEERKKKELLTGRTGLLGGDRQLDGSYEEELRKLERAADSFWDELFVSSLILSKTLGSEI